MSWVVSACEPSGDVLGGAVLRGLASRGLRPTVTGFSGPAMRQAADLVSLGDIEDLSASGLVEVIPRLPALRKARTRLDAALTDRSGPALLIDGPDLHLPVARRAPRIVGAPIGMLVCPQFWAWRPGRLRRLHEAVDFVLCLFAFEVDLLRPHGVMAHWVGHPALERIDPPAAQKSVGDILRVAVLPGSRPHEVSRLLRPILAGLKAALGDEPYRVTVPWRPEQPPPALDVDFVRRPADDVLGASDVAVVAAGTATLEAALAGVPSLVVARTNPITGAIARRLVRVPHVGLPNLLLKRPAWTELIQDLTPARFVRPLRTLVNDAEHGAPHARALAEELRERLGPSGFGERCADVLGPFAEST